MANTTMREKSIKELFIGECWAYLRNNFHKFNQLNQIKIALALTTKDMGDKVEGVNQQIVIMGEVKRDKEPMRFNIGGVSGN